MIAINEQQKREKAEKIQAREEQIGKNLKKLKQWTKDITDRKEKKEEVMSSSSLLKVVYLPFLFLGCSSC